jgi:hypothetical protein
MTRSIIAIVAVAVLALTPSAAMAQAQPAAPKAGAAAPGIAGKWNLVTTTQQGTIESLLDMKVDGAKVSGSLSSQMGTAPVTGEYTDGKLSFTITMQGNGQAIEVWFGGALQQDGTMAGTLDFGQGEVPWTARRVPEAAPAAPAPSAAPAAPAVSLAGKWNMALDLPNMGTATPTLDIKQDGEKLSGTYTGSYGTFPIEGTLKARTIEFWFSMTAEGTPVRLSFRGELAADNDTIGKGTGSIEGMGEVTWSAKRAK